MEQLKNIKQCLMAQLQGQMGNLQNVDTKELGEVVDMIKDLEEAMYYCSIVKAMEKSEEQEKYQMMNSSHNQMYYPMYYPEYPRDMDRDNGRMYYSGNGSSNGSSNGNSGGNNSRGGGTRGYDGMEMRDYREGRSPMSRRTYMEGKQMHHAKDVQMKELEKYLQELSQDVTEMVQDASPEEKQMLQQKISILATKIK